MPDLQQQVRVLILHYVMITFIVHFVQSHQSNTSHFVIPGYNVLTYTVFHSSATTINHASGSILLQDILIINISLQLVASGRSYNHSLMVMVIAFIFIIETVKVIFHEFTTPNIGSNTYVKIVYIQLLKRIYYV